MKKYINKSLILNFIIMFISFLMIEISFKLVNRFSILDWSIFRIIVSSIAFSLIISCIEYFIPKKIHKYINLVIIFLISIYSLAQTGFNNFIGVYMSLGTSSQLGAVIDYIREFILSFKWFYYFTLLPFVLLLIYYIFINKLVIKKINISLKNKKLKSLNKNKLIKNAWAVSVILVGLFSIYLSTLKLPFMQNELQTVSNRQLFENPNIPSIAVKQFGIANFGVLDIKNYFLPNEERVEVIEEENNNKKNITRSFDDTKWNALIDKESDTTMNTLNKYFINNKITDTNEYTGYFKDKNLIVIMLESVNDIIINKEDYPNFYKMYSEGWHWENNYSPRNSCSTGNNEMSGMIGLYSIYNTCTANIYKNNTYYESLFGLFNDNNYYTFSAHDYTAHYYDRDTIHTNMGSTKYYDVEDLGIPFSSQYKNWASDEDFMTEILKIIDDVESDNYMAWLTTVSSHQPYYYSSTEGDKYLSLYEGLDLRIDLKRYKSKLKILDNALGILLDGLKESGKLKDTVIVMYGDHYPYGLSTSTINTVLDYDTNVDFETERVPFVIYNSELESKVFKEYTSYINLLPTLANLFGIEYDPRLYVGTDLLSEDYESLVVFADGSWKNEFAYYNASKASIEYFTDKVYSVEELQKINNKIDNKMKMSSLAIKNNYFNYLHNALYEES